MNRACVGLMSARLKTEEVKTERNHETGLGYRWQLG